MAAPPPPSFDDEDAYPEAAAPPTAAAPPPLSEPGTDMPSALREEFARIETWAQANKKDASRDALRFWSLKVPAILVSATSGVLAFYKLNGIAVLMGAIASFCVLMDGLNPGGTLRNVHLRAFNELRNLQSTMRSQWDAGSLRGQDRNLLAAQIIEASAKEKERINAYITAAETSLDTVRPSSRSSGTSRKHRG